MNEEHDESHDDVSRLLAAASGDAASPESVEMPEHVARRLDDVLAGLVSERAGSNVPAAEAPAGALAEAAAAPTEADDRAEPPAGAPGDAPAEELVGPVPSDEVIGVTELASRRRRRWPRLLVAAAAVSVIGLGVGTMLEGGPEFSAQGERATAGASSDGLAADRSGSSADEEARDSADKAAPEVQRNDGSMALADGSRPPRLRTSSLTADVQDVEDSLTPVPVSGLPNDLSRTCLQPRTRPGDEWLPVRLDGQEAVLVLRAPADGRRTADVFTCDSARTPAASTVVDAQ